MAPTVSDYPHALLCQASLAAILGVVHVVSRALVIRQTGTVRRGYTLAHLRLCARPLCFTRNPALLLAAPIHPAVGDSPCFLPWDRCRLQSGELLQ